MKKTLIIFFIIAFSSYANASTIQTPFSLSLDSKIFEQYFFESVVSNSLEGSATIPLENIQISDPFPLQVEGIQLSVNYSFFSPKKEKNVWNFQSKEITATLQIQKIEANHIIQVVRNGTLYEIRVNGICENVQLHLPIHTTQANGSIAFLTGPQLKLQSFDVNWQPGSWVIDSLHCTGPEGFDQMIQSKAEELLQTVNPYLADIQTQIQNTLDLGLKNSFSAKFNISDSPKIQATLISGPAIHSVPEVVSFNGNLTIRFPQAEDCSFTSNKSVEIRPRKNTISIPLESALAILHCSQKSGALTFQSSTKNLTPFRELQKSKISMKYVWPDLLRFSESSIFSLRAKISDEIQWRNIKRIQKNLFTSQVKFPMNLQVFAPESGRYLPYLQFASPISGLAQIQISNDSLKMKVSSPLQLQMKWSDDYLSSHSVNTYLNLDKIEPILEDYVGKRMSIPLPPLKLASGILWQPQEADLLGNVMQMSFRIE